MTDEEIKQLQDHNAYLIRELNSSHAAEIKTKKAQVEAEKALMAHMKAPLVWHYCGKERKVRPWSTLLCSCSTEHKDEDNFEPLTEFRKVEESRGAGWECLDMVKDALEVCGTDMSATPPMFYEEAIKNTMARWARPLKEIQKRLAAIPHGRPGTGLAEMLKPK